MNLHNTLDRERAEYELTKAEESNPGQWGAHSRYAAKACELIAEKTPGMDGETAYILGLLHDIGRYAGVFSEKHLLDGYRFCMQYGWEKPAQICITHAFMIQDVKSSMGEFDMPQADYDFIKEFVEQAVYDDYDLLVQMCDSLALPAGFCTLEKRFVDVALRYGTPPSTASRWKKTLEIKKKFDQYTGDSIYRLLPGIEDCIYW